MTPSAWMFLTLVGVGIALIGLLMEIKQTMRRLDDHLVRMSRLLRERLPTPPAVQKIEDEVPL
jgi:hypothetical protein